MRGYHKSWQNKRPGFTKRVRWYQGPSTDEGKSGYIRLDFEDHDDGLQVNRFYPTKEDATLDYEAFIAGEKDVADLLDELEA